MEINRRIEFCDKGWDLGVEVYRDGSTLVILGTPGVEVRVPLSDAGRKKLIEALKKEGE